MRKILGRLLFLLESALAIVIFLLIAGTIFLAGICSELDPDGRTTASKMYGCHTTTTS